MCCLLEEKKFFRGKGWEYYYRIWWCTSIFNLVGQMDEACSYIRMLAANAGRVAGLKNSCYMIRCYHYYNTKKSKILGCFNNILAKSLRQDDKNVA